MMLICLVLLLLDCLQLYSSLMALWLSLYITLSWISHPCSFRTYRVHTTWVSTLSTPTSLDSVELLVFTFVFLEWTQDPHVTMVMKPPVWLFMALCAVNVASTYHFMLPELPIESVNGRPMVPCIYLSPFPTSCNHKYWYLSPQ